MRPSIDDLLPVRLRRTTLRRADADLERIRRRMEAVDTHQREIQTLDRQREKLARDLTWIDYTLIDGQSVDAQIVVEHGRIIDLIWKKIQKTAGKYTIRNRLDLPVMPKIKRGEIAFHDVTFAYDGKNPVLKNIDLHIAPKTTVALVGRSGSGKSTLVKLIPRFYDPKSGYVSIDGQDIRHAQLYSLRQQIGFAMQGSTLFQGTVLDNLTFGRNIPMQDVEDAASAACIHDTIITLPDGYHTRVGEQGAQLSEGQKQRVALARVLLQDTPILILDEPTSSLDTESEHSIQRALETIREGRTTLIIAHRLHTIQNADEIVILEAGEISEHGKHDVLISANGIYATLSAQAV